MVDGANAVTDVRATLRQNVHLMGGLLGHAIDGHLGSDFLDKIEHIRGLSKAARTGDDVAYKELLEFLHGLSDQERARLSTI